MTQFEDNNLIVLPKHDARHIPVLLRPVLAGLAPLRDAHIIDGTFGAGGYSRALLDAGAHIVALDRDPNAIRDGKAMEAHYAPRLRLVQTEFSKLDQVVDEKVDAVILDIGVSSMQIDEAERGFSFQKDGPLDMRMAQAGYTAADVVNRLKLGDLTRIFNFLGEERHALRIARMIERRRKEKLFTTTGDLANAIEATIGRKPTDPIHPATRVFQALRIYVNDELGQLAKALFAAERILAPNGRLGVVTFHSLEDRMVKKFFTARCGGIIGSRHLPETMTIAPTFKLLFKGGQSADDEELQQNPRARSARLRVGVRTQAKVLPEDMAIFGLPAITAFDGGKK